MALPTDAKERKNVPMARGLLDYFPDALAAVADVSRVGNEQHNPGQPLHWSKHLSTDHADCLVRHLVDRGRRDVDGLRHTAKVAWRALALLQMELEAEAEGLPIDTYIELLKDEAGAKSNQPCVLAAGVENTKALLKDTYNDKGFDVVTRQPCGCVVLHGTEDRHLTCYGGNETHYCKDLYVGPHQGA
jgi:hypothetical protein